MKRFKLENLLRAEGYMTKRPLGMIPVPGEFTMRQWKVIKFGPVLKQLLGKGIITVVDFTQVRVQRIVKLLGGKTIPGKTMKKQSH